MSNGGVSGTSTGRDVVAATAAPISPFVDFVAGTVAGAATILVGHPFDSIKVRLQASSSSRSSLGLFTQIVRTESPAALFKGVTSPLLGVASINSVVFGSYGLFLASLEGRPKQAQDEGEAATESRQSNLMNVLLAGMGSGIATAPLTTPIERLKILRQNDATVGATGTRLERIKQLGKDAGGIRGLYRGFGVTCLRDLGYGPYFLTYEFFLHAPIFPESDLPGPSTAQTLLAGFVAGIAGWTATFPLDVLKTRIQATKASAADAGDGLWTVARKAYTQEGATVFWRGIGPTVLRAGPVNMVCFFVFEAVVKMLS